MEPAAAAGEGDPRPGPPGGGAAAGGEGAAGAEAISGPSATDMEEEAEEERAFAAAQRFAEQQKVAAAARPEELRGASCARYGCGAGLGDSRICQCNPACHESDSCCADYTAVCWQDAPPPPGAQGPEGRGDEELLAVR
ncbi:unnamed protein product [Prorocentrum cordatum]|uniref:SMB domain-containing protein n=1 Tax=Prorocentrum cordatum TaxID=2364126 RepID=A0ABN9USP7_9DINO|nr:unnamed protein product [Polarella glacialis]